LPPARESVIRSKIRHIPALLCVVAAALGTVSAATAEPGTVAGKQAEAQRIISQITSLDRQVSAAVERWNFANVKLEQIGRDLKRSRHELGVSKVNLKHAQNDLARQAIDVYMAGGSNSTIEVILGATSLDDLLNRVDTVNRVNDQRTSVVGDVQAFQTRVKRIAKKLQVEQSQQQQIVAQRAAQRRSIERQLATRRQLLSSVKSEIAHMQAVERSRQLQLARSARSASTLQGPRIGGALGLGVATSETSIAPPSQYGGVVGIAMRYLGTPYVWGGSSPGGFDCSGLVVFAFGQMGVSLPHSTYALYGMGVPVSQGQLQAGDLVFFNGLGHMGIYMGGGQFIHAPHTGDFVKISSMTGWYASTYVGARRIL
jgi:cell wall-associated NlpC family hydrolase